MTVKEIARRLSPVLDVSYVEATRLTDSVLLEIAQGLKAGRRVMLHGFGSFRVRTLKARQGRNPKTGTPVAIPERKKVAFRYLGSL